MPCAASSPPAPCCSSPSPPSASFLSSSVSAAPMPSSSSALFPSGTALTPFATTAAGETANVPHKKRPAMVHQQQSERRFHRVEAASRDRSAVHLAHGPSSIAVPPASNGPREAHQKQQKEQNRRSSTHKGGGGEGMAVIIQQKLFENYHLVAYSLVIVTYVLAFCEYLYLRLLSLVFPEPLVYRRSCDKHHFELVIRNEVHFASGCALFLVMSVYQLVCFFLLTVSSRFMQVHRTYAHVLSIEQRLRHELVFAVQRTMFATLFPTFAIYLLCSAVILCSIFYMVGLRDPIVHVGSRVIVYVFDLFVVLYFLAFPVLCVLFHPDIDCRVRLARFCCWHHRRRAKAAAAEQPNSVGSKSLGTVTEATEEQMGANPNDHGTDAFVDNAVGGTKNAGGTDKAIGIRPKGRPFSICGAVHSVPAKMEAMAKGGKEWRGERGEGKGAVSECSSVPTMQQPMAQSGTTTNYGSLERRPRGMLVTHDLETKAAALPMETSVGIRAIRQRRRGDKYRRLRGGSDESAECRLSTTNEVKTKTGTGMEMKRGGGEADEPEEQKTRDERRHAEKRAEETEAWEDAGTVSC